MNNLTELKKIIYTLSATLVISSLITANAFAGWSVNGTKVLDPKGNNFIFRGINHAHVWYPDKTAQAMTDIAATGANSIRVVLANGTQWSRVGGADVTTIISQCKAAKMVCVLEVHDSTGFGESAAATNISNATTYWTSSDIKNAIIGQEDYVIINIANEPYGNGVSASTYVSETSAAIKAIRNAGLTHLIMVDAPNWGQDWSGIMRDNAGAVFAADSLSNTMFSVHMYEVYNSASAVQNYLTSFQAKGYALIVGEFGTENNGSNVDEASILSYSQQMGIGYMGWSWAGNGSCCVPLDIAVGWSPTSLSTWGNYLINSANGIKATSKLATIFTHGTSSSAASSSVKSSASSVASSRSSAASGEQCNWYGTIYPVCASTASGWGYENNKSCVARASCAAQPAPYGIVGNVSSSSSSSKSSSSVVSSASSSKSSVASSSSSSSIANTSLNCVYIVTNSWSGGYQGAIRVTNNSNKAISSWAATWKYAGANRITGSWNATLTGTNPYTATNVSYNGSVGVGQTVELGVQGNTNGGAIETPVVTCK